jgi:hypothetical protein
MSAAPSPRPRPKPGAAQLDIKPTAPAEVKAVTVTSKRRRNPVVEFLGRTWDRHATHPQVGWDLAEECLATPDLLERIKAQHAADDSAQVSK